MTTQEWLLQKKSEFDNAPQETLLDMLDSANYVISRLIANPTKNHVTLAGNLLKYHELFLTEIGYFGEEEL